MEVQEVKEQLKDIFRAVINNDKWITIHPNGEDGKGRPLLLKDGESPKEAIERTYGKDKQSDTKDGEEDFEKGTKSTKKDEDRHQKVRDLEDKAYKEFKKTYDNYINGDVKISDFGKAKEQFNKKYKDAFDKLESDRFVSFEDFAKRENKQSDTKDGVNWKNKDYTNVSDDELREKLYDITKRLDEKHGSFENAPYSEKEEYYFYNNMLNKGYRSKGNNPDTKDKQSDTKDDEPINVTEDYYNRISKEELQKEFKDIQKEFAKWKDKKNFPEYKGYRNKLLKIKDIYEKRFGKSKADNSKEQDMALIEELKKLITKVENDKGEKDMEIENEKVDKRDIIRQIMAIAGKEEASEDVKTIAKLAEKLAYDKSEAGTADNKCKNEDDEKEVEEIEEDVKEDVENRGKKNVKNSKTDYFAKLDEIYNSAANALEKCEYVSRADREKAAEDYFAR